MHTNFNLNEHLGSGTRSNKIVSAAEAVRLVGVLGAVRKVPHRGQRQKAALVHRLLIRLKHRSMGKWE